jgi:hypothetical protein
MNRWILVMLFSGLFLGPNLSAESFELKQKKIKITKKNEGIFPEIELMSTVPRGLVDQPRYRSEYPQRFLTKFGVNTQIAFAVDEKKGAGKGYDLMYVDVTGSGDLKRAKRIMGKSISTWYRFEELEFPPFKIAIPGADGEDPLEVPVHARFFKEEDQPTVSSLYLTTLCVMEGTISIGGVKAKMVVFDANCNGIFGEKGSPGGSKVEGDKIWIGNESPKLEEACTEAIPLGKYYCFNDEYYEISFPDTRHVAVQKADVFLGTIRVNNAGFLLELVQEDGVIYVSNEKGKEARVPTGKYRVNNAGFRCRHKGKIWTLVGEPNKRSSPFTVKENEVTEIELGPPLRLVIDTEFYNHGTALYASLSFSLKGSKGEKYRYLRKDGKKVDLPEIAIRNSRNKVVEKGRFHYG